MRIVIEIPFVSRSQRQGFEKVGYIGEETGMSEHVFPTLYKKYDEAVSTFIFGAFTL